MKQLIFLSLILSNFYSFSQERFSLKIPFDSIVKNNKIDLHHKESFYKFIESSVFNQKSKIDFFKYKSKNQSELIKVPDFQNIEFEQFPDIKGGTVEVLKYFYISVFKDEGSENGARGYDGFSDSIVVDAVGNFQPYIIHENYMKIANINDLKSIIFLYNQKQTVEFIGFELNKTYLDLEPIFIKNENEQPFKDIELIFIELFNKLK